MSVTADTGAVDIPTEDELVERASAPLSPHGLHLLARDIDRRAWVEGGNGLTGIKLALRIAFQASEGRCL